MLQKKSMMCIFFQRVNPWNNPFLLDKLDHVIHITKSHLPATATTVVRLHSSAVRRKHRSDPRLNQRPPAPTTRRRAADFWGNFPAGCRGNGALGAVFCEVLGRHFMGMSWTGIEMVGQDLGYKKYRDDKKSWMSTRKFGMELGSQNWVLGLGNTGCRNSGCVIFWWKLSWFVKKKVWGNKI